MSLQYLLNDSLPVNPFLLEENDSSGGLILDYKCELVLSLLFTQAELNLAIDDGEVQFIFPTSQ